MSQGRLPSNISTEAQGEHTEPKPSNSSSEKVKEVSEHGLGWPNTCNTDLSRDKPSGATHIFKRNVKNKSRKRNHKSRKSHEKGIILPEKISPPCVIKFAQFKVNPLLSVLFMLRCCALGKALAETVTFRVWADNFPVVIKQQERVCSGLKERDGSCVLGEGWQAQAMLAEQAYFQAEPGSLTHKCNFSSVHHRNEAG